MGGQGVLLGGVPGVPRAKVLILGGGTVGANACRIAYGMGADVTILDLNAARLEYLDDIYGGKITTLYSTEGNLIDALQQADLVIGAVLVPEMCIRARFTGDPQAFASWKTAPYFYGEGAEP